MKAETTEQAMRGGNRYTMKRVIFDANVHVGLPAERCTAVGAVGELMGLKGIFLCVR